jgi:alginate O-acetyltransferase complex protein AlgI
MLFNSFIFIFGFLPVTYAVFWWLRSARHRYIWLALSGYVFYGYWDARFCLLMAFSTLVSYCAGLAFLRYQQPRLRRLALVIPVCVDLSLLGFFKYAGFALRSGQWLAGSLGINAHFPVFDVILPVGISFYTFHTITYIVDSYRGVIKPTRNLFEFSAYVSLFSQLVAGPIVRFRQIEGDLEGLGYAERGRWLLPGISFFVMGLAEKVLIADSLANFVDPSLQHYITLSTTGAWLTMLAYSLQLYFDFCGYSDMAVGLGLFFGLRIPQNFNSPYKAVNPSDFWRRWHISLSTCLRDYLYIPLGGNRGGELLTYRNMMLTMLIGGLWHGANWTFVAWGGYHGVLLVVYRMAPHIWDALPRVAAQSLMFVLVLVGWVFFRAPDFTSAGHILRTMLTPALGTVPSDSGVLVTLLVLAAYLAMVSRNAFELNAQRTWTRGWQTAMAVSFGACLAVMAGGRNSPFLYFQF